MEVTLALKEFKKLKDHLKNILRSYSTEAIQKDYEFIDGLKPNIQLLLTNFYGGTQEYLKFNTELNMVTRSRVIGSSLDTLHDLIWWVDLVIQDLELKQRILNERITRAENQQQAKSSQNSNQAGASTYLKPLMIIVFIFLTYLLFSLPVLLNYDLNVWIKYVAELILVGFLTIGLISKRTDYRNQIVGFIIQGIIVAIALMLPNIIKFQ